MKEQQRSAKLKRLRYPAVVVVAVVAAAVALTACGGSSSPSSGNSSPAAGSGTSFVGSGSTFAQPLYSAWAQTYQGVTGDKLNYQGVGSSAGIAAIEGKTVQFGATDAPLTESDLQTNGLVQFPTAVGGTVVIVNLSGVADGALTLNGSVLAGIYLGKITKWNDAAIKALNPGLNLPSTPIHVVHRSDGSGTSWIFTSYLSAVSPTWKSQIGANTTPSWPAGAGAAKSAGVAALVHQLQGSLGYVEYSYAKQNDIATAKLVNADGKTLAPTLESFAAAAKNATWDASRGFAQALVDEPGAAAWPITGATYVLVQKDQPSAATGKKILKFFDWGYKNGAAQAQGLDYVPIPASVYTLAEQQWSQVTAGGSPVWP